jgi:hypothetical protein
MLTVILAVLSVSAAASMRIALPLLIIGLFYHQDLWSQIPLLRYLKPQVALAILISLSLFELFASKKLIGQRILQLFQLFLSPLVGGLTAVTTAKVVNLHSIPVWLIALIGAIFALILTLVQVGWFFRLRGIPIWMVVIEDFLCVCLVFFAFAAPFEGGVIALLLLWLAIRSSHAWRDWYLAKKKSSAEEV